MGPSGISITPNDYGRAFEHFIVVEALRRSMYRKNDYVFSYLRTKDGAEVDLIVERPGKPLVLLEIKSGDQVDERDTRGLERFLADMPGAVGMCLSRDPVSKLIGNVRAVPWFEGLKELEL